MKNLKFLLLISLILPGNNMIAKNFIVLSEQEVCQDAFKRSGIFNAPSIEYAKELENIKRCCELWTAYNIATDEEQLNFSEENNECKRLLSKAKVREIGSTIRHE